MEITEQQIKIAFGALMGFNGDKYAYEVITTGQLCETSYKAITQNVFFNDASSILEHFGLVQWFYYQGKRV